MNKNMVKGVKFPSTHFTVKNGLFYINISLNKVKQLKIAITLRYKNRVVMFYYNFT